MRLKLLALCLGAVALSTMSAAAGPAEVGESLAAPVVGMTSGCDGGVAAGESAGLGPFTIVTALLGCAGGLVVGAVEGVVTLPAAVVN